MNRIYSRLAKLELIRASLPNSCRTCGYPQRGAERVVVTSHTNPLPTCESCGQPLDVDGVPLHTPYKRVILDRPDLV
jgi:hypothetical protein